MDSTAPPPDDALRELVDAHASVLLAYLSRLNHGDQHRAEDMLQETFLRAWRNPQARMADGGWSRRWLFTVARNVAIDYFRAASARPSEVGLDDHATPAGSTGPADQVAEGDDVRAALARLPDGQRQVLVEIFYRDRSVADVAKALQIPPGTVKSRTYYALRALRDELRRRSESFGQ